MTDFRNSIRVIKYYCKFPGSFLLIEQVPALVFIFESNEVFGAIDFYYPVFEQLGTGKKYRIAYRFRFG